MERGLVKRPIVSGLAAIVFFAMCFTISKLYQRRQRVHRQHDLQVIIDGFKKSEDVLHLTKGGVNTVTQKQESSRLIPHNQTGIMQGQRHLRILHNDGAMVSIISGQCIATEASAAQHKAFLEFVYFTVSRILKINHDGHRLAKTKSFQLIILYIFDEHH